MSMCYQKKQSHPKASRPKAHQLCTSTACTPDNVSFDHLDDDSLTEDSFCLQVRIKVNSESGQKVPRPIHLLANLAYRLKPHHCQNLYLRARLDMGAEVNLMLASVYQLVFADPNMQQLVPSQLQVGTYTTDMVKIIGSCTLHLVHPDTKKLLGTTFYVAMNDRSILLSCKTTLHLGLLQPKSRLDYLPPRASLITSTADHPNKTKAILHIQKDGTSKQESEQKLDTKQTAIKENVPN